MLKENVAKADLEIAELDKLVDHVREVCHLIPAVFGHFLFSFCLYIFVHFGYYCIFLYTFGQVMRSDLELVKGSPQLLALLREIEGNEAPQNY